MIDLLFADFGLVWTIQGPSPPSLITLELVILDISYLDVEIGAIVASEIAVSDHTAQHLQYLKFECCLV